MKKITTLIVFAFAALFVNAQDNALNATLLGSWDDDSLPTHAFGTFNDVWGYAANGREYAIMGSASFVHVMDVTDPANIEEITRITPGVNTTWRDFKTFGTYAYCVADNSGEGLLVLDLSALPDTVTIASQSTQDFGSAHNIFIDHATGRLYTSNNPMQIFDIATDPAQPTLIAAPSLAATIGSSSDIHDHYIDNNIMYISAGNPGLFIVDFTDAANPVLKASLLTGNYNHSNWPSEDGNSLIVAEEVPAGLELIMVDISNMEGGEADLITRFSDPLIANPVTSLSATPHNPYVLGDFAFVSYYEDGVVVFDISDPTAPTRIAYYDTFTDNDNVGLYSGYDGCWGVYPYLPSGNVIASDMKYGLQVIEFDLTNTVSAEELPTVVEAFEVFPNPVDDKLNVKLSVYKNSEITFQLTDITGKVLSRQKMSAAGSRTFEMDMSIYTAGVYYLTIQNEDQIFSRKVVKQ